MSADNQISVIKFQKSTGEVVWRVFENTISGGDYEILWISSTVIDRQRFVELPIETSFEDAYRVAIDMKKAVGICEYGIHANPDGPIYTFRNIKAHCEEQGYDMEKYFEISDQAYAQLKKSWLIEKVKNHA